MPHRFTRSIVSAIGLLVCFWGMWMSGRAGYSRLLSNRVKREDAPIASVSQAIRLSPSDPKAYYDRGRALSKTGQLAEASKDFQIAVALRPEDYLLWLRLGYTRAKLDDQEGALAAYREALRLAPYYAQPPWYLGKLLLQAGHRDEAFAELRRAVASNPKFLPETLNLAWTAYDQDPHAVEQAIQPQTTAARLALAQFFTKYGKATEAVELFRGSSIPIKDRLPLLNALLAGKRFIEAYELWASGREGSSEGHTSGIAKIIDGGFESEISLDDPGFGWQIAGNLQTGRISLDTNEPRRGRYGLRLDWNGDSNPSLPLISQLVLVEPKTRYRLSFAGRTLELLTIGLPVVTVTDASSDDERVLEQPKAFPRGTSGWQDYMIEFATGETTSAVLISIRRQHCSGPCGIFGHLWVDDFSLERL
jgi:tetratricopeptide repeat protein